MRHVTDTLFSFNFSECVTLVIDLFFYSNFTLWNSKVTYYHGTESEILKLYLQGGPKKNGASGFHCKYFENFTTELRGNIASTCLFIYSLSSGLMTAQLMS